MWIRIEEIVKTHPEGGQRRKGVQLVRKIIGEFKAESDSHILDQSWIVLSHQRSALPNGPTTPNEHARRVKVVNCTPTTMTIPRASDYAQLGVTLDVIDPDLLDELTLPETTSSSRQDIKDVLKHHKIWWPA